MSDIKEQPIDTLRWLVKGEDINDKYSWHYEEGILLTTRQADDVVKQFDRLKEQNERLKEALIELKRWVTDTHVAENAIIKANKALKSCES